MFDINCLKMGVFHCLRLALPFDMSVNTFLKNYLCVCVTLSSGRRHLKKPERGVRSLRPGVTGRSEPPDVQHRCWALKSGPL